VSSSNTKKICYRKNRIRLRQRNETKKEREEKGKRVQEEKERKQKEREEKKKRKGCQKMEKEKAQEKRKKRQTNRKRQKTDGDNQNADTDMKRPTAVDIDNAHANGNSDTDNDIKHLTTTEDIENALASGVLIPVSGPSFNRDVCFGCAGEKDNEYFDWVACECGKWFHVQCTNDESLKGKSVDEIDKMTYVCILFMSGLLV